MATQPRLIKPDCHRPVNWNEAAVERCLAAQGHVYAQVKKDGIRFHAWLDQAEDVRIVTREGIEIKSLVVVKHGLEGLLQALPEGFVVDGEVTIPGVPFEEASGILRRFEAVSAPVQFHVWDTFPLTTLLGSTPFEHSYDNRLGNLIKAFTQQNTENVYVITCEVCSSMAELTKFFDDAREKGEEGLVVKDPGLHVRNGKVTGQWKMKPSDTCDGKVVGIVWGTPGLGNAGKIVGFTVELEDGTLCDATGLTQAQMAECTAQHHASGYGGTCPILGRYCEVSYMEKTRTGSLRHPNFVQFRDLEYAPGIKS